MPAQTNIEWCDSTFNPWVGCTKVSPACDNCYAEALMDKRMHKAEWGPGKPRVLTGFANWEQPKKWNAKPFYECSGCGWRGEGTFITDIHTEQACQRCGDAFNLVIARRRVFCASLADVFDNEVNPQWRALLFALIKGTPNIDWLLLTKRIGNIKTLMRDVIRTLSPICSDKIPLLPSNVWLGATICNQEEADRDIPKLLRVPAVVRFLSIEPILGHVDLTRIEVGDRGFHASAFGGHHDDNYYEFDQGVNWVIVGGESGPNARPMHPDWVRSLRDQCVSAGVPFLFKQWGEWGFTPYPSHGMKPYESVTLGAEQLFRCGKKLAGRSLDGVEWNQFPGSAA